MKEIEKMANGLTETLKDSNFQDVAKEIGEITIENFIDSDIVRDIPILGTIVGLARAATSIQDKLFYRKMLTFLLQLKDTSQESRRAQIDRIDMDPNYQTKVGEKLLFIIDRCEDNEKAALVGKLFKFFLMDKLSYDDFLRACRCIELTYLSDLRGFINEKWIMLDIEEAGELLGSGLMNATYTSPRLIIGSSEGSGVSVHVSAIGVKIQELLNENKI